MDEKIGLGDVIEKVTRALGIKPCAGCKKRRDALNKIRLKNFLQMPKKK